MPVHDRSRSDQDENLPPPGPPHSQRNPEQFVQGSQSTARSLRVQSQQLPTESQVFEDEVRPTTERTDQPAEEVPDRHDHGKNFSGKDRIKLCAKSLISHVYDLLARHRDIEVVFFNKALSSPGKGGYRISVSDYATIRL
jgi:hypothetical protein